jgi:mannose-6-phosphate isomerase-like protein (cupin superfamily)
VFVSPRSQRATPGKRFLQEALGLSGMEVSLNALPRGAGTPFVHRHRRNEEVYLFVAGRGQFQVDGETFGVGEGTVVRVSPEGGRALRNVGDGPLVFVVVQAPAGQIGGATISDGELVSPSVSWPPAG